VRRKTGGCLGLVILMLVTGLSCGLKSPPRPAKTEEPPRVDELKGDWRDREVVLTGRLSGAEMRDKGVSQRWTARIYHAWFGPGRNPCEGCPIRYTGYVEAVPEKAADGEFVCRVPVERDAGTHFFEVRLAGPKDSLGPRSNQVKMTVQNRPEAGEAAKITGGGER
jgi:hypothetical protein